MEVKTVGVACDHAGFPLKQFVIQYLEAKGYQYKISGHTATRVATILILLIRWQKPWRRENAILASPSAEVVKEWP